MLADWSVECGADDPVLVVPWSDATRSSHFVDLRLNPYDLDQISESEQHVALLQALRALNADRSPVFSAKCDAWVLHEEERARLLVDLFLEQRTELTHGFGSYIDLIWRERTVFASFHQHEQIFHRLVRHAEMLDQPYAALECVLRPALVDFAGAQEGFAVSMYVRALGPDAADADAHWAEALGALVALVRSKDLSYT